MDSNYIWEKKMAGIIIYIINWNENFKELSTDLKCGDKLHYKQCIF